MANENQLAPWEQLALQSGTPDQPAAAQSQAQPAPQQQQPAQPLTPWESLALQTGTPAGQSTPEEKEDAKPSLISRVEDVGKSVVNRAQATVSGWQGAPETQTLGGSLGSAKDVLRDATTFAKHMISHVTGNDVTNSQLFTEPTTAKVNEPVLRFENVMTPEEQKRHPITATALEKISGLTSLPNIGLMAAMDGLGNFPGVGPILAKLATAGFTAEQIMSAFSYVPAFRKAWLDKDVDTAEKILTGFTMDVAFALASGQHMANENSPEKYMSKDENWSWPGMKDAVVDFYAKGLEKIGVTKNVAASVLGKPLPTQAGGVQETRVPNPGLRTVREKLAGAGVSKESNPIEDIKSAFLSDLKPSEQDKVAQVGFNALHAEHAENTIHNPEEAEAAINNQIALAEKKFKEQVTDQIPNEPIVKDGKPVSVWNEVKNEIASRKPSKAGFVDDAMKALEEYGITKDKPITMADADRIRQDLNAETTKIEAMPEHKEARIEKIDPRYAAFQVAKDILRDGVYDTAEAHGLDEGVGAREFRRDIVGNLIEFRNQIDRSIKKPEQIVKGTAPEENLARKMARGGIQTGVPAAVGAGVGALEGHATSGALAGAGVGALAASRVGEAVLPTPTDLTRSELLDRALAHPQAEKFVTETPAEQQIRGRIKKPEVPPARGQQGIPFGPPEIFGQNQGEVSPMEMRSEQLEKIGTFLNKLRDVLVDPAATSVEKDAAHHQIEMIFGKDNVPEAFKRPKGQGAAKTAPKLEAQDILGNVLEEAVTEAKIKNAQRPGQSRFETPGEIKTNTGLDTKAVLNHELAHAALAHMAGFAPRDIISSKHMEVKSPTVASTRVDVPANMFKREDGTLEPKGLREHLPNVLAMYLGGGVANELYDGMKIEDNKSLSGDLNEVKETLDLLSLSEDEKDRFIMWGMTRARAVLSDPDVENLINEFSDTRERGLPESHHYSVARINEFRDRLDSLRGKNANDVKGTYGVGAELNPARQSSGEGSAKKLSAREASSATTADEVRETPEEASKRELFESLRLPYKPPPKGTGPNTIPIKLDVTEGPKIGYGKPEEFNEAVQNTPGAKVEGKKVTVDVSRYQKPEQAGDVSPRTGVFFLPETKSPFERHYRDKRNWYGGTQKVAGKLTLENPMVIKGATGGKVPERAYDAIKGDGAYQAMRQDVLKAIYPILGKSENIESVRDVLQKYGGDPDMAEKIVDVSQKGNTLPFAVQEHIVAHAVRNAGHDGLIGYTSRRTGKHLSEVFDLTRKTFPDGDLIGLIGLTTAGALASGLAPKAQAQSQDIFKSSKEDQEVFKTWPVTGPKDASGMVTPGNIDLTKRPLVHHKDGGISTLYSTSFGTDQGEVLVPAVSPDGKMLTTAQALELYKKTGQHLGIFKTVAQANAYANMLHEKQAAFQTWKNGGEYKPTVETTDEIK